MTWRDTLKARSVDGAPLVGRFRQARFIVPNSDATFGRRAELHEYPQRDIPWVEDLGRKARQFTIEVFVDGRLGGDYLSARDALIAAIEEPGPGTLVHPWYGTLNVALAEPASVRESTREGGRATFRLTFVEAGELRFPSSARDTSLVVDRRADAVLSAATDIFADTFDVSGLPGWSLAALEADLAATLAELEKQVSGVTGTIAAEIRAPANMAAAIVGSVQRLGAVATEPLRAMQLYRRLFDAGDDNQNAPATTPTLRRQVRNAAAARRLVQQAAVAEACRASSQADYSTRDDALATAELLQDALDKQMAAADPVTGSPVEDGVYQALAALHAAVSSDLLERGARLPELVSYTPRATLPALVVAHRLYGDARRAEEITNRNRIRHPGFVPGGEELEVLNG